MKRLLPVLLLLFLAACSEEPFDVSSLSLRGSTMITIADEADRHEHLTLSAAFSNPDESYTYRLVSPDGTLVWEGSMSGSDILSSEAIELTAGASFLSGDYSVLFYSTNGTELSSSVPYNSDRSYPSFIDGVLSSDAYVIEYDEEGLVLEEGDREGGYALPDGVSRAEITAVDRFGNSLSVSQSFQQEA